MKGDLYEWRDAPREEAVLCCPECGEELSFRDEIYTRELSDTVAGCSQCLHGHNAVEWLAEQGQEDWLPEEWARRAGNDE